VSIFASHSDLNNPTESHKSGTCRRDISGWFSWLKRSLVVRLIAIFVMAQEKSFGSATATAYIKLQLITQ
jgi:hypothetical protein